MIRRIGHAPRSDQRYVLLPGAYAILPRRGQLLLTWQGAPHNEVQLPGGGIDPDESAITALHREVFEETGIDQPVEAFCDWQQTNQYEILAHWRKRYAPGVTHNTEHLF